MEEILSIHSFVHKKKKNTNKNKKNLSIIQSVSKTPKNMNFHSSNNLISVFNKKNNISKDLNSNEMKNLSQKKPRKTNYLSIKYGFELQNEPLLYTKNDNLKILSEKEAKANTPVMNLQKNKKPNYLMKSAFIKDKSLTPQEKSFQNSLCPIYDFYKGNPGFNTTKNDNLVPNSSFTQYYNNFKNSNNSQPNDYLNPSPSPPTNLSDKNNMNYYYNFSFMAKKQTGKDFYEPDKINEEYHDKSSSIEEKEINYKLYNIEKDDNFGEIKNEIKNIEGNTPSNLGGAVSPSYDLFDEKIFSNDNNLFKSPINYKQMNVNININNNSQNNNIYYQLPNIINHFNNNSSSNFNNNQNNNKETNNNEEKYINYNNHNYQNINQLNNNLNAILKRQNIGNIENDIHDNLNNNRVNMDNHSDFNRGYNTQNIISSPINYNNHPNSTNFSPFYNKTMYQNEMNNRTNQLNQLSNLNQNIGNYMNQFSKLNNNINMNDIASQNYRNNNINNYNANYVDKNLNNQNYINFSSMANAYMNHNMIKQDIYNNNLNIKQFPMKMPIQNPNNINNNKLYNQPLQYYINQDKIFYQNNNNIYNQNFNNKNNYPYMNNINAFNQYNQNKNSGIINNHMNNIILQNNNIMAESFLCQLSPIQLAQQCHIIAKSQNGCRYLQNYISSNPDLLKKFFFQKILEHFQELSNDQFSNYLIKKIFQYLNEEMLFSLIQTLIPIVDQIGTNQYGTRVLQDLIDFLSTEKIFLAFVNIIIPHVKLLVTDLNGSHIIYKLILTKNKKVKIIEDIICLQVKDISITRKGCSFLKKYFDFENENDLIKIKQCILQNLAEIITDQYGNYVIQSILTKEGSIIVKDFINEISKNIVAFSNNKFSSNAVEKCFENKSMKNIILDQLIQKDIFEKIILDKFGNYVVQKAIAKADDNRRNYMLQLLIPLIPSLKSQYFGQRLLSKLIIQYPIINNSS